jgi:hypothetical protein
MIHQKSTLKEVPSIHVSDPDRYGRQTAGVLIVLALLGAVQMFLSGNVAQSGDVATHVEPIPAEMAPTDYFPAQYVNQAQHSQPEEHIQAF